MAAHSSILAWEIPWTEEPGGLQSMGSQRVGHDIRTQQRQENESSRLHSTCIVLGIVNSLKMTESIQGAVLQLSANTVVLYKGQESFQILVSEVADRYKDG